MDLDGFIGYMNMNMNILCEGMSSLKSQKNYNGYYPSNNMQSKPN